MDIPGREGFISPHFQLGAWPLGVLVDRSPRGSPVRSFFPETWILGSLMEKSEGFLKDKESPGVFFGRAKLLGHIQSFAVDGWNPVNSPVEVGSLAHYLQVLGPFQVVQNFFHQQHLLRLGGFGKEFLGSKYLLSRYDWMSIGKKWWKPYQVFETLPRVLLELLPETNIAMPSQTEIQSSNRWLSGAMFVSGRVYSEMFIE